MKKSLRGKLSLSRETLGGLEEVRRGALPRIEGGGSDANTCFATCYCRSAYTCYWSDCGC